MSYSRCSRECLSKSALNRLSNDYWLIKGRQRIKHESYGNNILCKYVYNKPPQPTVTSVLPDYLDYAYVITLSK